MSTPDVPPAALTEEECGAIVGASLNPARVLAGRDGHEGSEPDVLLTTVSAILAVREQRWRECVEEVERERDGVFYVGGREVTRADYLALTDALEYGNDGFQSPAAHPRDLIDPLQQAMYDAREHCECPRICEPCGETLASDDCEHCYGSGCGPGTASGAYSECEWCAGAGRVHPGCAEQSYTDLRVRAEAAEERLRAVAALADEWQSWAVEKVLDINAERRSVAKMVVRYVSDLRAVLGQTATGEGR